SRNQITVDFNHWFILMKNHFQNISRRCMRPLISTPLPHKKSHAEMKSETHSGAHNLRKLH
ncbi:MAG: hypothetical protein ACI92E_000245, partial [Oceanicoccus sp.]